MTSGNCSNSARCCSNSLLPITTSSTGQSSCARRTAKSGPTPAGSPGVNAMRATLIHLTQLFNDSFNVSFVANFLLPILKLFLVLATKQQLIGAILLTALSSVLHATVKNFGNMPTELGFKWLTDFANR